MLAIFQCPDRPVEWFHGSGIKKRRAQGCFFKALLFFICCLPLDSIAADKGRFDVRSADSRLIGGVYLATARIDYHLSPDALEALESGVVLTVQLQVEVHRVRRFWPDKKVAELQQDYQLSFQPLTARYVVKNINSGDQSSFQALSAALAYLGQVADLPIIDAALLQSDARYRIALRAVLDQNTLPGPLQMLVFWSNGFRLESDWYWWNLSE